MSANDVVTILDAKSIKILDIINNSGTIEDPQGFATRRIADNFPGPEKARLSDDLRKLDELGLISRNINGKRTYEIKMTDAGLDALSKVHPLLNNGHEEIDPTSLSTDQIMQGLFYHLNNSHTIDDCPSTQFEDSLHQAEAILDQISHTMTQLNEGEMTWTSAIENINNILDDYNVPASAQ